MSTFKSTTKKIFLAFTFTLPQISTALGNDQIRCKYDFNITDPSVNSPQFQCLDQRVTNTTVFTDAQQDVKDVETLFNEVFNLGDVGILGNFVLSFRRPFTTNDT